MPDDLIDGAPPTDPTTVPGPAAPAGAIETTTVAKIGERIVDIAGVVPFRLPVWRALRKDGVDPMRLSRSAARGELELEPLEKIAIMAVRLAEPLMPMDEIVNGLHLGTVTSLALAVLAAEGKEIDRPTSTGSSSLPNGGAGDPVTLPN
jgi:hypothetical protein